MKLFCIFFHDKCFYCINNHAWTLLNIWQTQKLKEKRAAIDRAKKKEKKKHATQWAVISGRVFTA